MRQRFTITLLAISCGLIFAHTAIAADPSIQPLKTFQPYNLSNFDLHIRPPAVSPTSPPPGAIPVLPLTNLPNLQGPVQHWRSFQSNGHTIYNRPTIYDSTYAAVRDTTTGAVFFYRDFASTVKIAPTQSPYDRK